MPLGIGTPGGMPIGGIPIGGMPIGGMPGMGGMPGIDGIPIGGIPMGRMPMGPAIMPIIVPIWAGFTEPDAMAWPMGHSFVR